MSSPGAPFGVAGINDIYDEQPSREGSSLFNDDGDSGSEDSQLSATTYATSMRSLQRKQTSQMIENAQAALAVRSRRPLIALDPDFMFQSDVRAGQGSVVSGATVTCHQHVEFYKKFVDSASIDALVMVQTRIGPSFRSNGFVPKNVHEEIIDPSMKMISQVFVNGTPNVHEQKHGPFLVEVKGKSLTLMLTPAEPLFATGTERETLGLDYYEVQIEEDESGVAVQSPRHPRLGKHEDSALALPVTHVPIFFDMACLNGADVTDITIGSSEGTQGVSFPHGLCMVLSGLGKILDGKQDGSVHLNLKRCFLTPELFASMKSKAIASLVIERCGILGQCTLPKMSRLKSLHINAFGLMNASLEVDMLNLPFLAHMHVDTRFRFVVRRTATQPVKGDAHTSWESASVLCIRNPNVRVLETLVLCVTLADVKALVGDEGEETALVDSIFRMCAKQVVVEAVQSTSQFQMVSMKDPNYMPERRVPFVTSPFDVNLSPFNTDVLEMHHLTELVPASGTRSREVVIQSRILSEYTREIILDQSKAQILWGRLSAMGTEVVSLGPTLSISMGFSRFGRPLATKKDDAEDGSNPKATNAPVPDEAVQRGMMFSPSRQGPSVVILAVEFYTSTESVWTPDAAKSRMWMLRYPLALPSLGLKRSGANDGITYQNVTVDRRMFLLRSDTRTPVFNETALVFCRADSDVYLPSNATQITSDSQLTAIRGEMATALDAVYPVVQPASMCSWLSGGHGIGRATRALVPKK
ncbi:MAG: hypothetical protein AB7P49_03690 [Bdellovibrionales bacterium]